MDRRRYLTLLTAAALVAGLAIPAASAAPARASKEITVLPTTVLHLTGTRIYCSIAKGNTVACFHLSSSLKRSGYAIAASERFVAVEPSGSTKPVFLRLQKSLKSLPVFSGGKTNGTFPIELKQGDIAAVGKTHMAVFVSAAKAGGSAIGIVYLDVHRNPVVGTYAIGISDHFVTVTKVVSAQKTKTVYRHAVK